MNINNDNYEKYFDIGKERTNEEKYELSNLAISAYHDPRVKLGINDKYSKPIAALLISLCLKSIEPNATYPYEDLSNIYTNTSTRAEHSIYSTMHNIYELDDGTFPNKTNDILDFSRRYLRTCLTAEFRFYNMIPRIDYETGNLVIKDDPQYDNVKLFYSPNGKPILIEFHPLGFPEDLRILSPIGLKSAWSVQSVVHSVRLACAHRMCIENPNAFTYDEFGYMYLKWAESVQRTYDGDTYELFSSAYNYYNESVGYNNHDKITDDMYRVLVGMVRDRCLNQHLYSELPCFISILIHIHNEYPKSENCFINGEGVIDIENINRDIIDFGVKNVKSGYSLKIPDYMIELIDTIKTDYNPLKLVPITE